MLRRTLATDCCVYVPQTWSFVHVDPSYFYGADIRLLAFQLRTRLILLLDAGVAALPLPSLGASLERVICNLAVRPNQSSQTADSFRFNGLGSSRPIHTSACRRCEKVKCTVGRGGGVGTVKMKEAPSRCKDPPPSLRTTRTAGRR